jgi:signal transduction histidine kinase
MRIRIDEPESTELAPAIIDEVTVDGLQTPSSQQLLLRPDTGRLELHYGVVQLRSQERVLFRYKLDGFDRDWSKATAERVTHYTNLPVGHYTFRVAAFEMNNPERIAETSLDIVQQPHFYQTVWFLTLCTLSLAAATWSVHKFRVGQLRARFQAVLNERTRLAREMHDTLIQGCVSVSALLEAYLSLGPEEPDARQNLMEYACNQLRTTVDEAREAVWNLRQRTASVTLLGPFLRSISEQIHREFGTPVECRISEESFVLPKDTIHELLMVVREAIYNAVRHGRPRKVEITVSFHRNECELRITDDGIGFEPGALSSLQVGHYGVVGMQERIQRIGGRFLVNSAPGTGTEVLIYVPRESAMPEPREAETLL